jgi:hypothetical protein
MHIAPRQAGAAGQRLSRKHERSFDMASRSKVKKLTEEIAMKKSHILLGVAAALMLGSSLIATQPAEAAGGCGPGAWRGPWGHCRNTPYYGRLPDGSWKFRNAYNGNGCPPGSWRGPWGHCRNTPYHGRLPDGSWK